MEEEVETAEFVKLTELFTLDLNTFKSIRL